jgi:hypothetical protein
MNPFLLEPKPRPVFLDFVPALLCFAFGVALAALLLSWGFE